MAKKIVVLGAGFGGLELSTMLSEAVGDDLDLVLIDKNDSFFFGFSKLDVMFGRKPADAVKMPYSKVVKPGVKFRQETITAIDPTTRRVTTDKSTYDADVLVIALGADYDQAATPGLAEGGNEFYSFAGAQRLSEILPTFTSGHAVVGVTGSQFKCPPAPSEAVLLLHDYLVQRGVRDACQLTLVMPFGLPIPPSPDASKSLLKAFAEREIAWVPNHTVRAVDPERRVLVLDDESEISYDLFLGVPRHRCPAVIAESGMTERGWIPVNPDTLETHFAGVYAVGDVTSVGTPRAGVFAEAAARIVARRLIAEFLGGDKPEAFAGAGSCYVEWGANRIGRVDVNFLSGPAPTGNFTEPSIELMRDKEEFGKSRRARWFGL